ncbi:MAG TPA: hypothetical protein DDZ90_13385, partial [Planctomycetaceae bacterium]|nr:hypothetical protein [Planctomycetaceae bacterium]
MKPGEFQIKLVLASDPAMHGTPAQNDLHDFDFQQRSLLLIDGQKNAWCYDREQDAATLLAQAQQALNSTQPETA